MYMCADRIDLFCVYSFTIYMYNMYIHISTFVVNMIKYYVKMYQKLY